MKKSSSSSVEEELEQKEEEEEAAVKKRGHSCVCVYDDYLTFCDDITYLLFSPTYIRLQLFC